MTDQPNSPDSPQDASAAVSHVSDHADTSGMGMFVDPSEDESLDAACDAVATEAEDAAVAVDEPADDAGHEVAYTDIVAVRFLTEAGHLQEPMIFKARSLSSDYMVIVSRKFIAPSTKGVVQIVRANGKLAIVGVQTSHCEYNAVVEAEEGTHELRLQFTQVPEEICAEELINADGRIELFDPLLENNVRKAG